MGKYKTFGSRFDRVHRNDLNANFAAVEADINAQKGRVDDLIIGTPQPSEVVDSRGGFPVLGDRLESISSTVAQSVTDIEPVKIKKTDISGYGRQRKTAVVFVSDDGKIQDIDILKPIFQSEGVPCTSAIVSSWVGTTGCMTQSQIKGLQDIGWEIASHTVNHTALGLSSEAAVEMEMLKSKTDLEAMGFKVNNFIYPFGSYSKTTKRIARKYYRSAGGFTNGQVNVPPFNTFNLYRPALGAFFDSFAPGYTIMNTYADYYKPLVDEAVTKNALLIFTLHPASPDFTTQQQDYLRQTIQYVKSLNIPILTMNQALDMVGNVIDVEGYSKDDSVEKYFRVAGDGSFDSSEFKVTTKIASANTYLGSTLPSGFPSGLISINIINSTGGYTGLPEATSGILTTDYTSSDITFVFQTYETKATGILYKRVSTGGGGWSSWVRYAKETHRFVADNTYLGSTLPSGFPTGLIVSNVINSTGGYTGLPESTSGILITDYSSNDSTFMFQTYKTKGTGITYTRASTGGGGWTAWAKVTTV
jgi:peptidoglycan/xylan/chitin deacetylase (PgdA/CDA1 family)